LLLLPKIETAQQGISFAVIDSSIMGQARVHKIEEQILKDWATQFCK